MTAPVYTRAGLDKARCMSPDCTIDHGPLYFHGRCHVSGGVEVYYEQGIVVIVCKVCRAEVARMGVV